MKEWAELKFKENWKKGGKAEKWEENNIKLLLPLNKSSWKNKKWKKIEKIKKE